MELVRFISTEPQRDPLKLFFSSVLGLQCCINFCCTEKWPGHICIYILFHLLSSIIVYPKRLDIVPYCIAVPHSKCNSLHLLYNPKLPFHPAPFLKNLYSTLYTRLHVRMNYIWTFQFLNKSKSKYDKTILFIITEVRHGYTVISMSVLVFVLSWNF